MFKVLSYIFSFLQTLSACILLEEYLQRNYPELHEKYKNVVINQSYNAIYLYSKLQIIFNKYKPYINEFIKDYPILRKIIGNYANNITYDVEFVIDGEVVYKTSKEKTIDSYDNIVQEKGEIDFIIYSQDYSTDNQNKIINRKIIKNKPTKDSDFICDKSDIKFILCEFSVGDKKFKVDFKNSTNNYYVVDNIFDVKFLKYFLQKYYSEHIKDINLNLAHDFKINIMDHNVESFVSDKENIVKISKEKYELLNNK